MKKNIMLIIPTLTGGGAEKTICNLSILLEKYYNVFLVVFSDKNITYKYAGKLINLDLLGNKRINIFQKCIRNILRIYKIKKIKKNYSIDTSISFLDTPNFLNIITKKKEKVIVSVRNLQSVTDSSKFRKKLTEFVLSRADKIVAISKLVKEDLEKNYRVESEKVEVIYNVCPIDEIQKKMFMKLDSKEDEFYQKGFNLITCGRLVEQKGQWHLIRVINKLLKKYPDLKLSILGQGELEDKLKKLVLDYNIENNVRFLGYQKNPYKFLIRADIFIFSSIYEGLGNTLLEVLACKVPIISSNCVAGPCEILDKSLNVDTKEIILGEYGILIPAFKNDNFDAISELNYEEKVLEELIDNIMNKKINIEKYKEVSQQRIIDFSEENIKKAWLKLIE